MFKQGDRVYVDAFEGINEVSTTGTVIGRDGIYYKVKMDWFGRDEITNEKYQSDPYRWHFLLLAELRKLTKLEELLLERE